MTNFPHKHVILDKKLLGSFQVFFHLDVLIQEDESGQVHRMDKGIVPKQLDNHPC